MDYSTDEVDEVMDESVEVLEYALMLAYNHENFHRSDGQDNVKEHYSDLVTFSDDFELRHVENEVMDFRQLIDCDSFDDVDEDVHPVIGYFVHSLMSSVMMTDATFH